MLKYYSWEMYKQGCTREDILIYQFNKDMRTNQVLHQETEENEADKEFADAFDIQQKKEKKGKGKKKQLSRKA